MARHSVLIVEDNEELRRLYRELFEHNNFEVSEAGDGQSAVDVALLNKPEIILLDLMLPRQGGLGVLKIIRSLPELKHIPVVVLTALPNPEYRQQAIDKVQGFYLKTEIKPKDLVLRVRELLDK